MKRLVSIIIALTLTLALLPATLITASAADEIVFDFKTNANKNWETYVYSEKAEYLNSSGKNRTFYYSANNGTQVYVGYTENAEDYIGEWVSFKLDVSGSGKYEASLYNYNTETMAKYFKGFDVYMLPAPQTEPADDAGKREYIWDAMNSGEYPAVTGLTDNESPHTFDVTLEEGVSEYLFILRRTGEDRNRLGFWKLTLTKQPEKADETVKLWAYPLNGNGTVTPNGVTDVRTGTSTTVTATATANEGYTFSHWQNSNGDFVSESASYTFTPYSNTILYAVFKDDATTEKIGVDFYDANRDYLGFVEAEAGAKFGEITAPTPDRIGYTFSGNWGIDENTVITDETVINNRISVVAIYDESGENIEANVTVNNEPASVSKYGEVVSKTISGVKSWYRDGRLADYGETYTYHVWGNTAITSSEEEIQEEKMLLLLDGPANGAYMIEYDEGNGTALEAGIIFGKTADVTVSSCYSKAKTASAKAHGQFTAKPATEKVTEGMQEYVRGYLIYKDTGNVIRIIYTDAVKITE